ncbi:MAG: hypothetical protein HY537_01505 [Deltaproteobacteria bacterium]|nr:hypothetical protein [Deltaproteobacteria bacterium]
MKALFTMFLLSGMAFGIEQPVEVDQLLKCQDGSEVAQVMADPIHSKILNIIFWPPRKI